MNDVTSIRLIRSKITTNMQWVTNVSAEVNAASQYPTILAVCGTLTALTLIVVSLRTYVRLKLPEGFRRDDGCVVLLAVSLFAA